MLGRERFYINIIREPKKGYYRMKPVDERVKLYYKRLCN